MYHVYKTNKSNKIENCDIHVKLYIHVNGLPVTVTPGCCNQFYFYVHKSTPHTAAPTDQTDDGEVTLFTTTSSQEGSLHGW